MPGTAIKESSRCVLVLAGSSKYFFFLRAASCLQAVRASRFNRTGAAGFTVFGSFCYMTNITFFCQASILCEQVYMNNASTSTKTCHVYGFGVFFLILFMRQASSSDLSFWFFCRVETTSLSKPFFDVGLHHLCGSRHFKR